MTITPFLEVLEPGPMLTTQDLGRPGLMYMGVTRSGAADRESLTLGNRLLGNPQGAVGLEATMGGAVVRAHGQLLVALTGAPAQARRNGRRVAHNSLVRLDSGDILALGAPRAGLRTYITVRGGLSVPKVLKSSSTDILSGIGPAPLQAGSLVPVAPPPTTVPVIDHAPRRRLSSTDTVVLEFTWGPRDEWLTAQARHLLMDQQWSVSTDTNRVGVRLHGPRLEYAKVGELLSEGVATGSIQVPPQGQPIVFLADHPVTGGYPVVGVVTAASVDRASQATPGQSIRFRAIPIGQRQPRLHEREELAL